MADELSELVDDPVERMDVEYKAWLDLSLPKVRADLARHIAAIANFGGGTIVFGIADDGTSCGAAPPEFMLDHDLVAGVTRKYLDPAVHCDVRRTTSKTGIEHPVIQVPAHGATPICAKANGPDSKGKIEGIQSGVHYLRKPGPESAPIQTAADWRDIIRRCALHDRTAILAAISAALAGAEARPGAGKDDVLERWAKAADDAYVAAIGDRNLTVPVNECRVQFSYRIITASDERLPLNNFEMTLRQLVAEVDRYNQSGWSLFYVFGGAGMAPHWMSDEAFGEEDFLEAKLVALDRSLGLDLWRVAPSGLATLIREYWEDTPDFGQSPRQTLNPRILTRVLGELIRHAEAFSARFPSPLQVEFRCEWRGLRGRTLYTPNTVPYSTQPAIVDRVLTHGTWPVADLGVKLPEIVEALAGKVARALNWTGLDAQRVAQEEPGWVKAL